MDNTNPYLTSYDRDPLFAQQLNRVFGKIDERLNDLEHKTLKTGKKTDISRAQKSAILHELGVFDYLLNLDIPQKKLAILLGLVFNSSAANVEKDLSQRHDRQAPFKTKEAYDFLVEQCKELKLNALQEKSQNTLDQLAD